MLQSASFTSEGVRTGWGYMWILTCFGIVCTVSYLKDFFIYMFYNLFRCTILYIKKIIHLKRYKGANLYIYTHVLHTSQDEFQERILIGFIFQLQYILNYYKI